MKCVYPRCQKPATGYCTLCSDASCEEHGPKHFNYKACPMMTAEAEAAA